ncbi:MAG: hypothetical protein ABL957_16765, partial [Parvularculaceae bacterium]
MLRRLLPLAPLSPALAVIAFAAAGAAAQSVAGLGAATNSIADVQVGERGRLMRVAIICAEDCRVGAKSSGVFFVPGITGNLDVDLKGRTTNADGLSFKAEAGGAALSIRSKTPIVTASIKRCMIGEAPASCIDIEFADGALAARALAVPPEGATRDEKTAAPMASSGPALREAPDGAKLIFASLAPPERFLPPSAPKAAEPAPADGPRLILDRRKAEALIGSR